MRFFIFFVVATLALRAQTSGPVELTSPNGELRFVFNLSPTGVPSYEIVHRDEPIIPTSKLGLARNPNSTLGGDWKERLKVVATERRTLDTTWQQVWGERATARSRPISKSSLRRPPYAPRCARGFTPIRPSPLVFPGSATARAPAPRLPPKTVPRAA